MEKNRNPITNDCSMSNIRPAILDLPYPPIQVQCRNQDYAALLAFDYCGSVSELSAITQYINNENRMFCDRCSMGKTILGMAMAEMMHMQKLGQLIHLLGGNVCYVTKQSGGRQWM